MLPLTTCFWRIIYGNRLNSAPRYRRLSTSDKVVLGWRVGEMLSGKWVIKKRNLQGELSLSLCKRHATVRRSSQFAVQMCEWQTNGERVTLCSVTKKEKKWINKRMQLLLRRGTVFHLRFVRASLPAPSFTGPVNVWSERYIDLSDTLHPMQSRYFPLSKNSAITTFLRP